MIMENWSLVSGLYSAPEFGIRLCGNVFGHKGFPDGSHITTSTVVDAKKENNIITVRTQSGSEYILGFIDKKYEKKFPNALERLLKAAGS